MKIEWGWEDGYVGRRPLQIIDVPEEDLEDLSESDRETVIDEYVKEAFLDQVRYFWKKK